LLTGDDTACDETKSWDPAVVTVPVKFAKDRFAAQLVPVAEAREAIETAAAQSLANLTTPPAERGPHRLTVRWQSASVALHLTAIPGVERHDDRTVTVEGDLLNLYRLFNLFLRVCTAVTSNPPYC
jgi:D-amino peptidase